MGTILFTIGGFAQLYQQFHYKEHLIEEYVDYILKYFTKEELENFREEIKLLKICLKLF